MTDAKKEKAQVDSQVRQRNLAWRLGMAENGIAIATKALFDAAGYLAYTPYNNISRAIVKNKDEISKLHHKIMDAATSYFETGREPIINSEEEKEA